MKREPVDTVENLKPILSLLDLEPVLPPEMSDGVVFKRNHLCSYYDAVKTILPGGIGYQIRYDYGLSPFEKGKTLPLIRRRKEPSPIWKTVKGW